MNTDTTKAVEQVEQAAKLADHEPRVIETMEVGQVARQGDIYLHRVDEGHARGKLRTGPNARQLALGSQAGARHVAEPPAVVFEGTALPAWCRERTFLGPCIESPKPFTVSHPEHAHVTLPAGTYQVTHQMDARTLDRVAD